MKRTDEALARSMVEWSRFAAALNQEDVRLFEAMLEEATPIAQRILSSGASVSADKAILMAVLLRT